MTDFHYKLDGDIAIMKAADHGMWLGSNVFDGARLANGLTPDLDKHCARVNASAEALMVTPNVTTEDMVAIAVRCPSITQMPPKPTTSSAMPTGMRANRKKNNAAMPIRPTTVSLIVGGPGL